MFGSLRVPLSDPVCYWNVIIQRPPPPTDTNRHSMASLLHFRHARQIFTTIPITCRNKHEFYPGRYNIELTSWGHEMESHPPPPPHTHTHTATETISLPTNPKWKVSYFFTDCYPMEPSWFPYQLHPTDHISLQKARWGIEWLKQMDANRQLCVHYIHPTIQGQWQQTRERNGGAPHQDNLTISFNHLTRLIISDK